MKEITKAKFINTWASEWDERTGWKVSEEYHKQFSEQLEYLINQEVEKRIAERMPKSKEEENNAFKLSGNKSLSSPYFTGFFDACKWLHSRLTQKTEGGEG
jgi:hypothetical protein